MAETVLVVTQKYRNRNKNKLLAVPKTLKRKLLSEERQSLILTLLVEGQLFIGVQVWMKDHQIKTLAWPAQSPDLNLIENL